MGPVIYLGFSVVMAFACGVSPNEENRLGTPTSTAGLQYVDQNGQYEDNNHDMIEERAIIGENDDLPEGYPYFINQRKMYNRYVKPEGNMINLKCKAAGDPTPTVTWTKNNEEPSRHLGNIRYGSWSLTIEDLETDDSGVYTCHVCNPKGCINFTYSVEVVERYHSRPILTQPPQNKTVVIGSNVNFTCTFIADLNPHIYWVRGIPIENGTAKALTVSNIKSSARSQNPEILELHNVTSDSEEWYTCVAANSLGVTSGSAYLKVVNTLEEGSHVQSMLLVVGIITVLTILGIVVVVTILRKLKQEKINKLLAVEATRAAGVTQRTKKAIVEKLQNNSSNATKLLASESNI